MPLKSVLPTWNARPDWPLISVGDVANGCVDENAPRMRAGPYLEIKSTRCATEFRTNIRNNNGFLVASRPMRATG